MTSHILSTKALSSADIAATATRAHWLHIDIAKQCLKHYHGHNLLHEFAVSTALNGAGEQSGSEQTPRGWHVVRASIGDGMAKNTVFRGRRPIVLSAPNVVPTAASMTAPEATAVVPPLNTPAITGVEIWTPERHAAQPGRDWILTRILWLSGMELGRNRGGAVDSMRRYIYIHGTPDCEPMGVARSHGCIRMRNDDLLTLFAAIKPGTPVLIEAQA